MNLLVRDRLVIVVGAGTVAARKITSLVELGARVEVIAPLVVDEVRARAANGEIVVHERAFAPADLDGAWLAFAATDDPAVNAAVHAAGEAAHVWVNSADDPANCAFTLMSVVRRGDLVVSVGTGGRSPALAAHLRGRLEDDLTGYDTLLDLLSDARERRRASGQSSEDLDWQRVFDEGIVELVRAGRIADAKELLDTCL